MIHSFAKLISKILVLRLAPRMDAIVDKNQNAFIKTRCIHDNYKYIQWAAVLIRRKKVPMLLLKLDISKAFDTLSWPFLLEALKARGFGEIWCKWIEALLCTASSKIILNGQQGPPPSDICVGSDKETPYPRCFLSLLWMCFTVCSPRPPEMGSCAR